LKGKKKDFQNVEEQETSLSPEATSPEPICTRQNPKPSAHPPRQTTKRKAANAATSSVVNDKGGEGNYKGDSTEEWEEDCELSDDCSDSELQESKTKKARKGLYQDTLCKKWASMFQLLIEYKDQHGNTLVPKRYNNNPQLGNWVQNQRRLHTKKELLGNRVLRLKSIGFVWCVQRLLWTQTGMQCFNCS